MLEKLAVGEKYIKFKDNSEGIKFDMSDSGGIITILFNKPTQDEVDNIKNGDLQFGLFIKDGIIFLLTKFGSMQWMDAPYHIALSPALTRLKEIGEGKGYGINIIFADTSSGEIKVLRYIGLNTKFSRKLKEAIEEQWVNCFNKLEYSSKLQQVMNTYSTKDMVRMSLENCKIRKKD